MGQRAWWGETGLGAGRIGPGSRRPVSDVLACAFLGDASKAQHWQFDKCPTTWSSKAIVRTFGASRLMAGSL